MGPAIHAIGTAVPDNTIQQSKVCDFMAIAHGLDEEDKRKLRILYRATGITQRHSVISDYNSTDFQQWQFYPQTKDMSPFPSTEDRGKIYRSNAIKLSKQAIQIAAAKSSISLDTITHLITVSCTGMYAPGLDFDIIDQLDLNRQIQRTSINFMGCYAAITAMKHATSICRANNKSTVLVICVELCTIHFQNENTEDNLLANSIFGDGAAAFIMTADHNLKSIGLRPAKFHSDIIPEGRKDMAWNIGNFGYEMKLSSYVPELIQGGIKSFAQGLTDQIGAKVNHFAIHPGGKKILEVIEKQLDIPREKNQAGHEVLRRYGNMSSPTLLFVLDQLMCSFDENNKGENILGLAFGPGLTLESAILEIVC